MRPLKEFVGLLNSDCATPTPGVCFRPPGKSSAKPPPAWHLWVTTRTSTSRVRVLLPTVRSPH